jgi:iron complex outermembrane receptor protein
MVRQPRFQISGEANYKLPVGNKDLTFTVSPSYNSMVYFDFANQLSQKGVFLLDGSVELDLRNGVKLAVFGRNITDTRYFTSQAFSTFHISTLYGAPATYGISASYAFK